MQRKSAIVQGRQLRIAVVGGGPVGSFAALALRHAVPAHVGIRFYEGGGLPPDDGRAAALIGGSLDKLEALGLLDAFRTRGTPMAGLRIVDVTGRLVRAPTALFSAAELDRAELGLSLPTREIVRTLREAIIETGSIEVVPGLLKSATRDPDGGWQLTGPNGQTEHADFVVACDGQNSMLRAKAEITVRRWSYPQTAITFAANHDRDHLDVSTEFHTAHGPFTLVPAGPCQSTVVWMTERRRADEMMAMPDAAFERAAEREIHSAFGALKLTGRRGAYPMGGLLAERVLAEDLALIGETAHAFPPIGAQGLNLGIRDAHGLAESLAQAFAVPDQAEDLLAVWEKDRLRDMRLITAGVDAFNQSLLTDLLPVAALRGFGMAALTAVPPLRQAVMRRGMG
jgi:2-octaprenyl-6-methoxyphenol hydroxylase